MATVFWDSEGILLIDYLEHGSLTITGTYYTDMIRKCRVALKRKRRGKLRCGVLFHQDNAPTHMSSLALIALLRHPSYSPDLAPGDYCSFPELKEFMRGWKLAHDDDVICTTNGWLDEQRSIILLQWHMGFGESLDQVHLC